MKRINTASILAFFIGAMAVFIGIRVAFLGQKMPYYVIDWLPVYNLIVGFLTVFLSTILIWKNTPLALPISIATLISHSAVTFFLLIAYAGTVSTYSLVAMLLRIIVWIFIIRLLVAQNKEPQS